MPRIDSLFRFVGNWINNYKTSVLGIKVGDGIQYGMSWTNKDIDLNTGAQTSANNRVSTITNISVYTKISIKAYDSYQFSIRCYDSSNNYLTPSPTPEWVSETATFDKADMPEGTSYIKIVSRASNDGNISATGFSKIRYYNQFVIPSTENKNIVHLIDGAEDSAIQLVPNNEDGSIEIKLRDWAFEKLIHSNGRWEEIFHSKANGSVSSWAQGRVNINTHDEFDIFVNISGTYWVCFHVNKYALAAVGSTWNIVNYFPTTAENGYVSLQLTKPSSGLVTISVVSARATGNTDVTHSCTIYVYGREI